MTRRPLRPGSSHKVPGGAVIPPRTDAHLFVDEQGGYPMGPRPDRDAPQVAQAADVLDAETCAMGFTAFEGCPAAPACPRPYDCSERGDCLAGTAIARAEAGEPLLGVDPDYHPADCTCDDHARPLRDDCRHCGAPIWLQAPFTGRPRWTWVHLDTGHVPCELVATPTDSRFA